MFMYVKTSSLHITKLCGIKDDVRQKDITVKEVCLILSISATMRMAKFNNEEAKGLTL